jgi:hypothetical protein
MQTWYLLLGNHPGEKPWIIKRCQAETKRDAATIFAKRLNTIAASEAYGEIELLEAIKREDELTKQEHQWIAAEDIEMLEI